MEISDNLKNRIISQVEALRPKLDEAIKTIPARTQFVLIPIVIDGVMETIRYDVAKKVFDQIEVRVARGGILTADWLDPNAAYCDTFDRITIPLVASRSMPDVIHQNT